MAEVYRGQVEGANGFVRPVAIKRVHGAWGRDSGFVDAFEREALLVAKLSHPNIVSVIDYQVDDQGLPFLVMEYVEGRDLATLAATGALPCSVAIFVIAEMLRGLAYAHQLPMSTGLRGIVHRDISPHNVLLSWQGDVKVSDFGIAKALSTQGAQSGAVRGKPSYMSPEQISSSALDGRSDLFAVGAVFWELLVGRRAFEGVTYSETLARVVYSPIPSLRDELPDISEDVEAVVGKLLARDRSERYSTAQEALADLLRCEAAPRDGVGELVALMQSRLNAVVPPPADTPVDPWPGPLGVKTRVPTERKTDTLNVPMTPLPSLGATLAAAGRISTGPHDATLGHISAGPHDATLGRTGPHDATIAAPFPAALPAASLPAVAAAVAMPLAGTLHVAVEARRLRETWRRRRRALAFGSVAVLCGLVASLMLRSKAEPSVSGQVPSTAPAAAAARPEASAVPPEPPETETAAKDQTPSIVEQARAVAPVAGRASAAVSQPTHGRAERSQHRPTGASRATTNQTEPQPLAPESKPQPMKRRIVEIDLSGNGGTAP